MVKLMAGTSFLVVVFSSFLVDFEIYYESTTNQLRILEHSGNMAALFS